MGTEIKCVQLNSGSLQLDQQLLSLGYKQRLHLDVPVRNTYFTVFGLAHLSHCLAKPQTAAALIEREAPADLKEAMAYIANRQTEYASVMSTQYIDYFLSPYQKLEASFAEGTEDMSKRLRDLFKVHIVVLQHPGNDVKVQADYTEGLAPILHLEMIGTTYCALIPANSNGFPLEGTQSQIQQHYFPDLAYSQDSQQYAGQEADPQWQLEPSSQPEQVLDTYTQSALNLVEIELQIIKSLVQANASLSVGENTIRLLADAERLAEYMKLNHYEYQSLRSTLEAAIGHSQPIQAVGQSSPPPNTALNPSPQTTNPLSTSTTLACRLCSNNSEYSMFYLDGNHRACQICYNCCARNTNCSCCGVAYSETERARFHVITST